MLILRSVAVVSLASYKLKSTETVTNYALYSIQHFRDSYIICKEFHPTDEVNCCVIYILNNKGQVCVT
jgi:hypothetical protein